MWLMCSRGHFTLFAAPARRANTLYLSSRRHGHTTGHRLAQSFRRHVTRSIECVPLWARSRPALHRQLANEPGESTADSLARFAARGLAAREVVQVHVHLAAVFDRRGCVAAEATADGVGDDTWLGLG